MYMLMFSYARLGTPWQSGADFRVYLGPMTIPSGHEDNIISSKRENPSEGSQAPPRSSPPTSDAQQAPGGAMVAGQPTGSLRFLARPPAPQHVCRRTAAGHRAARPEALRGGERAAPRRRVRRARPATEKAPRGGRAPPLSGSCAALSRPPPPALSGSHGVLPPAESAARAIGLQTRAREEADARAAREIKRRAARRFTSALSLISRRALPAS